MKFANITLILILFLTSQNLNADAIQAKRFTRWLDSLEKTIGPNSTAEEAMEALLNSGSSRVAAFNLQALGRVYTGLDAKNFNNLMRDYKKIEDSIGQVDKWENLGNEDKAELARESFVEALENGNWVSGNGSPRIQQTRQFLKNFNWPTQDKDQVYVTQEIMLQLQNVEDTEYQFETLEHGNGLHTLKKELRWFLIYSRVVNGAIYFKPTNTSCPIPEYESLLTHPIASSKYAALDFSPDVEKPCLISRCLYLAMVKMTEDVNRLKDDAEQLIGNTGSDKVPEEIRVKAEAFYSEFKELQGMPTLLSELQTCTQ